LSSSSVFWSWAGVVLLPHRVLVEARQQRVTFDRLLTALRIPTVASARHLR
jgi:hypothetical protein